MSAGTPSKANASFAEQLTQLKTGKSGVMASDNLLSEGSQSDSFFLSTFSALEAWVFSDLVVRATRKHDTLLQSLPSEVRTAVLRGLIFEANKIFGREKNRLRGAYATDQAPGKPTVSFDYDGVAKQLSDRFGPSQLGIYEMENAVTGALLKAKADRPVESWTSAGAPPENGGFRLLSNDEMLRLLGFIWTRPPAESTSSTFFRPMVVVGGSSRNAGTLKTVGSFLPAAGPRASLAYQEETPMCGFEQQKVVSVRPQSVCKRTNTPGILQCEIQPKVNVETRAVPMKCQSNYQAMDFGVDILQDEKGNLIRRNNIREQKVSEIRKPIYKNAFVPVQTMRQISLSTSGDTATPPRDPAISALVDTVFQPKQKDVVELALASIVPAAPVRNGGGLSATEGHETATRGPRAPPARNAHGRFAKRTAGDAGVEETRKFDPLAEQLRLILSQPRRSRFSINAQDVAAMSYTNWNESTVIVSGNSSLKASERNPGSESALATFNLNDPTLEPVQNHQRGRGYKFSESFKPLEELDKMHVAYHAALSATMLLLQLLFPEWQPRSPNPLMTIAQLEGHIFTTLASVEASAKEPQYDVIFEALVTATSEIDDSVIDHTIRNYIRFGEKQKASRGKETSIDLSAIVQQTNSGLPNVFLNPSSSEIKNGMVQGEIRSDFGDKRNLMIVESLRPSSSSAPSNGDEVVVKRRVRDQVFLRPMTRPLTILPPHWTPPEAAPKDAPSSSSSDSYYPGEAKSIELMDRLHRIIFDEIKSIPDPAAFNQEFVTGAPPTSLGDANKGSYVRLPVWQPELPTERKMESKTRGMASVDLLSLLAEMQAFGWAINANGPAVRDVVRELMEPKMRRFLHQDLVGYLTLYTSHEETKRLFYLRDLRKERLERETDAAKNASEKGLVIHIPDRFSPNLIGFVPLISRGRFGGNKPAKKKSTKAISKSRRR